MVTSCVFAGGVSLPFHVREDELDVAGLEPGDAELVFRRRTHQRALARLQLALHVAEVLNLDEVAAFAGAVVELPAVAGGRIAIELDSRAVVDIDLERRGLRRSSGGAQGQRDCCGHGGKNGTLIAAMGVSDGLQHSASSSVSIFNAGRVVGPKPNRGYRQRTAWQARHAQMCIMLLWKLTSW